MYFIFGLLADIIQVVVLAIIWHFHFVPFGLPELKPGHFFVIMIFIGLLNSSLYNPDIQDDEYLKKLITKKLASSLIAAILATALYYINLYI